MQQVTIEATMADGTVLVEQTGDFGTFASLALGFRRDPECIRLVWRVSPLEQPAGAAVRPLTMVA